MANKRKPKITAEDYARAEANGINKATLRTRVYRMKWTAERASTQRVYGARESSEMGHAARWKPFFNEEQLKQVVESGIPRAIVRMRMNRSGWTFEEAISTPILPPQERGKRAAEVRHGRQKSRAIPHKTSYGPRIQYEEPENIEVPKNPERDLKAERQQRVQLLQAIEQATSDKERAKLRNQLLMIGRN